MSKLLYQKVLYSCQALKLDHSLSSGSQNVIPGPATSVSGPLEFVRSASPQAPSQAQENECREGSSSPCCNQLMMSTGRKSLRCGRGRHWDAKPAAFCPVLPHLVPVGHLGFISLLFCWHHNKGYEGQEMFPTVPEKGGNTSS